MAVSIKGPGGGSTKMEITNGKLEKYLAYSENLEKNTFVELSRQEVAIQNLIDYELFQSLTDDKVIWEDDNSCLILSKQIGNYPNLIYVKSDESYSTDRLKCTQPVVLSSYGFSIDQCHFIGKMSANRFAFYLYDYSLGSRLVIARYNESANEMAVGTSLSIYSNDYYKYSVIGDNIIAVKPFEYSYSSGARVEVTLYTVDVLTITERNYITVISDDKYNASRPELNEPYITGNNSAIIFGKKDMDNGYIITPIFISGNEVSKGTSVVDPEGWNMNTDDLHLPVDDTSLIWYYGSYANYCISKENKLYVGKINNSNFSNFEGGVFKNISSGKVVYHSNTDPATLMYVEKTNTTMTQRFYGETTDIVGIIYDIFIPSYDESIVHFIGMDNSYPCLWREKIENNTLVYKDKVRGNGIFDLSTIYAGRAGDVGVIISKFNDYDEFIVSFVNYNSQKIIYTYKNIFESPQYEQELKILNDGKRIWVIYIRNQIIYIVSHIIDLTVKDVYDEESDVNDIVSSFQSSGLLKIFPRSNGVSFVSFIYGRSDDTGNLLSEFDIITNPDNDIIIPGIIALKAKNKIDGLTAEKIKKMYFGNVTVLNTES